MPAERDGESEKIWKLYWATAGFFIEYSKNKSNPISRVNGDAVPDISGLDTAVHGPVRLGVMTALQVEGTMGFTALKKRLRVADGAIGMHLQKLEEIGYVSSRKAFVGKRPKTSYTMTQKGREALFGYLQTMQRLIDSLGMESADQPNKNTKT